MKCGGWILFTVTGILLTTFLGLRISNSIHPFMPEFFRLKLGILNQGMCGFYGYDSGIFDQPIGESMVALFGSIMCLCGIYLLEETQRQHAAENEKATKECRDAATMCGLFSTAAWMFFFYAEVFIDPIASGDGGQLFGLLRYLLFDQPPQQF